MTRAELEAAAAEKYPGCCSCDVGHERAISRAAYIQGRLDQAEADARLAKAMWENEADGYYGQACFEVAAAIREGVKDV